MIHEPMFWAVAASVGIVLLILLAGIATFAVGGEFNRKYANKIMRLRLVAQLIAVIVIIAFVLIVRSGN